jgi:hypothetical protein
VLAEQDVKIQNGFKVRGIAPPDLASYDATTRKLYWTWVLKLALARKDKELAAGLDKDGKPLRAISEYTRKHRRSAMTPSGKGDPAAPPLTPGLQKSRTRSLLAGRALSTHVDMFWRFDGFTGESWAVVLSYQAARGRDVFGISDEGLASIKVKSWALWESWKSNFARTGSAATEAAAKTTTTRSATTSRRQAGESMTVNKGRAPTADATYGIGASAPRKGHGGRTPAEWAAYFRQTAAAAPPGRAASPPSKSPIVGPRYNRLLSHVWGRAGGAAPGRSGARLPKIGPQTPPKTPSKTPRPAPRIPAPTVPAKLPANRLDKLGAGRIPTIPPTKPLEPRKGPMSAADFIRDVLAAAANVPMEKRYGDNKVWIHDVWAEYLKLPGAIPMSLNAFKLLIVDEYALRSRMARADLVQAMNPSDVEASDTHYRSGSRILATFNFFKLPRK